jgi:hypothetical protein
MNRIVAAVFQATMVELSGAESERRIFTTTKRH